MKPLSWYKEIAADSRARRDARRFLAEGPRAIGQLLAVAPDAVEELLAFEHVSDLSYPSHFPVRILTERQFSSIVSSKTPQGIAAVVRIPEKTWETELPSEPGGRVLLLDGVQDPGNVGALVRTAAALGCDGMIVSMECADPFSPKAVQASAGSVLSLWLRRTERHIDLAKDLRRRGFSLLAADVKGEPAAPSILSLPHCLMLGSEGAGLSSELQALADKKICIPIDRKRAESLNVAAAGAILMYLGTTSLV